MTKKKKSRRGGAREGAGRPTTTGTGSAKPISFKVPAQDRALGERIASALGISVSELAKREFVGLLHKWVDAARKNRQGEQRIR